LLLSLSRAVSSQAATTNLRIMAFNTYWGGLDYPPVENRGDEWLQVIRAEQPDIAVFEECWQWLGSELGLLDACVDSLNATLPSAPYYQGFAGVGSWILHVCLVSRHPVTHFEYFNEVVVDGVPIPINHVFIHATIQVAGEPVHVVGVHYKSGQNRTWREQEARAMLAILDTIPAGETIWVLGDFNSYSPVDVAPGSPTPPDYAHGATSPELIGWEPVGYLLDRGFVDSFRTLHPLVSGYTQETTEFLPVTAGPTKRVDFILRSPNSGWSLFDSRIHDDAVGDNASDHYAVISDFRKDPAAIDGAREADRTPRAPIASPNPFAARCRLRIPPGAPPATSLAVFDAGGRLVRRLQPGGSNPPGEWTWDGRTEAGAPAPNGIYLVRAQSASESRAVKVWKLGR
jgi:endonuclease/exonuclease/phosphatase family metal-dependent hydrolase